MPQIAAEKVSSSWIRLRSAPCSPAKADASVMPSAGSTRTTSPPATTRSIERTRSGKGPKSTPDPCVEVETTPPIVWAS